MRSFFLKRTIEMFATMLLVSSITFFLLKSLPGGPFDDEMAIDPEVQNRLRQFYGLDQPVSTQYLLYLKNMIRGDFGSSFQFPDESVSAILASSFPTSFSLGAMSLVLSLFVGLLVGITCVAWRGSWVDRGLMFLAGSGIALPSFVVAPLFVLIFAIHLGWLPPALWEGPSYWILPVATLALRPVSILARLVRSSGLDIVDEDFIAAIRSRGASEYRVFLKHVLKNSLVPVLGIVGPIAAGVLSGSFVIEFIFAIPGAGHHLVESVLARDYPLVMAMVMVYTLILTIAHWSADVCLHWVDPRVRSAGGER